MDEQDVYDSDPEAIYSLLDVLNEHQVRRLANLLHQIRAAAGWGEVSVQMERGEAKFMTVKVSERLDVGEKGARA